MTAGVKSSGAAVASVAATSAASLKSSKRTHSAGLPDSVSNFYYKHGLFISSYPTCASSIAIVAILFSCYPLINIPLPGTIPTKIVLPYEAGKYNFNTDSTIDKNSSQARSIFNISDDTAQATAPTAATATCCDPPLFPWAQNSPPALYIQQIMLRASVMPWTNDMQLMDAFRAPLYEVFKLLEIVRNHESRKNQHTLGQLCLHVDNVKRTQNEQIFPEYNCLVLSPANLWGQDVLNFSKDANILNTIFQYHNLQKSKVSTAEMLFGLPMQDTGFKRYPLRARSRIIQYAITLILKHNDPEYLDTLREKLLRHYPIPVVHQQQQQQQQHQSQDHQEGKPPHRRQFSCITYIFYPGEFKIWEFLPLCIAFILLFAYIYFSVRKIDVIRSRVLLALCSVVTVLGSLVMSVGLCFFFGLTISLQSKDIFPYLVVLVGLENCLVITKSVVSTDETFDVKIRVAQALSKEGWHISKTLMTEITILTIGLATFVPVIQEFCVFAIVGLLSDFMLQMLLFSTILAMNLKNMEYTMEAKQMPKMLLNYTSVHPHNSHHRQNGYSEFRFFGNGHAVAAGGYSPPTPSSMLPPLGFGMFHRSQSHPKLAFGDMVMNQVVATATPTTAIPNESVNHKRTSSSSSHERIPKRLKLVNFWARTRFFQRAFMVWMSVWICSIVCNSGYLENLFVLDNNNRTILNNEDLQRNAYASRGALSSFLTNVQYIINAAGARAKLSGGGSEHVGACGGGYSEAFKAPHHLDDETVNETDVEMRRLLYPDYELNHFLSKFHWSTIMKQYNISISGHYVAILPTIKLSHAITPEMALLVRNPNEKVVQNFQWKALAAALDPLDFNDDENRESPLIMPGGTPLFPKSPMEIFFAITLCCISIFVLCYTMVVFYRCICTRNYAEWRSSWYEYSEIAPKAEQMVFEGVPTQIIGHKHKIECLVSDGSTIISCCLKGDIKVWDARSGEKLSTINRSEMQISTLHQTPPQVRGELHQQARMQRVSNSPVWCMDYYDNLIAVGCANGRVELWETPAGILKCAYQEEQKRNQGITHIHLNGDRIIVARLCGRLDFYRLETYYQGRQIDWGFTSAYRRTHVRTGSTGSISLMRQQQHQQQRSLDQQKIAKEEMKCTLESVRLAHRQPITCIEIVNGLVFTGSQDHTLKVYSLHDPDLEYTLHGHCGPITCLFVDRWQPSLGGSGSQDGLLCVWDLFTGACMYNIQAHDGAISCLTYAPSYIISLGTDERICVWERFQGNLFTTINISNPYSSLLMLTPSLLVTSKMGSLIVWDVRTGEPAREVKLDCANSQLCPEIMLLAGDSVVCDYGNEIRVVRFPIVTDKCN